MKLVRWQLLNQSRACFAWNVGDLADGCLRIIGTRSKHYTGGEESEKMGSERVLLHYNAA